MKGVHCTGTHTHTYTHTYIHIYIYNTFIILLLFLFVPILRYNIVFFTAIIFIFSKDGLIQLFLHY